MIEYKEITKSFYYIETSLFKRIRSTSLIFFATPQTNQKLSS